MFLIVVDACSKWLEIHCMKSTTSSATIQKLRGIFATHGLPTTLVSDNGTNFTSSEFEQFMRRNGIKHMKVSSYHPASNGQAERAVRIFKEGFEKMEHGSVETKLSRFLLSYRTTPHTTTGVPPAQLLMKRKLHTHLDLMFLNVGDRVRNRQSQQKVAHDYHAQEREIQEGQVVYAKDFRSKKTWIPGRVVRKTGPVSTQVQLEGGTVIRRHQDHVRTCRDPDMAQQEASDIQGTVPTFEAVVAPPTLGTNDQPNHPETQPAVVSAEQPVESNPPCTHPVRKRTTPAHLKDYVCEL